ncbi:hypothetical protein HJFPF1_04579 [Paramyrothecium foliicola]|nr:hypothetical protein HJFPF1_04579 [Paramyrothecium foliicola]
MKPSTFYTLFRLLACSLAALVSKPNRVAGVWELANATYTVNDEIVESPFGENPHGLITLTQSGWFVEQINKRGLPTLPPDRGDGTNEDIIAVAQGTFGISGTYTTDENGDFFSQSVL